jgi:hypothetical protein
MHRNCVCAKGATISARTMAPAEIVEAQRGITAAHQATNAISSHPTCPRNLEAVSARTIGLSAEVRSGAFRADAGAMKA